jgi:hypothetical protein
VEGRIPSMVKRNSIEDTFNGEQKLRILSVQHFFRLRCMAEFLGGTSKVWRWAVRQETQRESWKRHSITVGAPRGGGVFLPSHNQILDTQAPAVFRHPRTGT